MSKYDREKMMSVIEFMNGDEDFVKSKGAIVVKPDEMDDDQIAGLVSEAVLGYYDESYGRTDCPHCGQKMPSPEMEITCSHCGKEVQYSSDLKKCPHCNKEITASAIENGKVICIFCGNDMNKKPVKPTVEEVQKKQVEVMGDLDNEPKPEPEPKQKRKRRTRAQIIEDEKRIAAESAKEEQKDIPELAEKEEVKPEPEKPVETPAKKETVNVSDETAKRILNDETKVVVQEKSPSKATKQFDLENMFNDDTQIVISIGELKRLLNDKE